MKKKLEAAEIGHRIKLFAYEKFGTIEDLAKALNVSASSLKTNYLSGKSLPGSQLLYDLMNVGCDIKWLFTGIRIDISKGEENLVKELEYFKEENVRLLKEIYSKDKILNKISDNIGVYKSKHTG